MSFLQQFFRDVFDPKSSVDYFTSPNQSKSLGAVAPELVQSQFEITSYGDFELTDAIRPSFDLEVQPTQGFRHEVYVDEESKSEVPVVMASVSRQHLFPMFMQLIQELGETVDVVLETSHDHAINGHLDLYREHIDLPVLTSILWEYEDLLTNDGCTGIAVLNPAIPQEIQFDEHKLLIMYGEPLGKFEAMLENQGVTHDPGIRFITEAEHVHSSTRKYQEQFEDLRLRLGTCSDAEECREDDGYEECW